MLRELKKCQGCQKLLRSVKEITTFASFFKLRVPSTTTIGIFQF